jgi:hypothetical protein
MIASGMQSGKQDTKSQISNKFQEKGIAREKSLQTMGNSFFYT